MLRRCPVLRSVFAKIRVSGLLLHRQLLSDSPPLQAASQPFATMSVATNGPNDSKLLRPRHPWRNSPVACPLERDHRLSVLGIGSHTDSLHSSQRAGL